MSKMLERGSMRLWLSDLLMAIALMLLGMVVPLLVLKHLCGDPLSRLLGESLAVFLGITVYCLVSRLIYQRFHLCPMWYPLCPKCGNGNRFYRFPAAKPTWPREVVTCCTCGCFLELWYGPMPKHADSSPTSPSFALVWPHSQGRWRRLNP